MNSQSEVNRWDEIRAIWKQNQWLYVLVGFLFGSLLSPFLQSISNEFGDLLQSLLPEAFGIVITVFLIDALARRRQNEKQAAELKQRLIFMARSRDNEIARSAIEELRYNGWLDGESSLLQNSDLSHADLHRVDLTDANLSNTYFWNTDLSYADLTGANLTNAHFNYFLLMIAHIPGADLSGAILFHANVSNADFLGATFNEDTILPDGKHWTPTTDLTRYTNPQHPEYWSMRDDEYGRASFFPNIRNRYKGN